MTGKDPLHPDTLDPFKSIFTPAGIDYKWLEDQYPEIWGKFIFISAFGMVTAAYNKTLGEVLASAELSGITRGIMSEIEAIAKAKGINMKPYIIEEAINKATGFPPATKTSFQRDYEISNKPDERDLFGGTVIRMGMEYNIATPAAAKVYELINTGKPIFY
jgi:2-dehydropantoate 2-reductase